jgi:hypothetical protein
MTPRDVDALSAAERRAFIEYANREIRQRNREARRRK